MKCFAKVVNSYNYFHNNSVSRCLSFEINMIFFKTYNFYSKSISNVMSEYCNIKCDIDISESYFYYVANILTCSMKLFQ